MSSMLATVEEAAKETPMHIDVKDLTFGYAGREVQSSPLKLGHVQNHLIHLTQTNSPLYYCSLCYVI